MIVHIDDENTNSSISSRPFHICPCDKRHLDCSTSLNTFSVYPGEMFHVSVVACGQRDGTVPAAVISHTDHGNLLGFQYIQQANNNCTKLNYSLFSISHQENLVLHADGPCSTFGEKLVLHLIINHTCPPGFTLSRSARSCICEQILEHYTNQCNITDKLGQITRGSHQHFWVGYDNHSQGLIIHPHCPFDYCVNFTVHFPLNNTNVQCAHNRSGLLCGTCKKNYSLVLGTHHCRKCTNSHLALLIPFAVMGVALIFFLLACKLTVATGTLSGLVFYTNIIGVNRSIFLPMESTDALSIFIAWLNLDFGIETCFYNGLDAYSKTWLQFAFPVYIWAPVGLIVLISYFSHKFANLLGNNPVSVLATLILLSYTKILRTLIAAIHITHLEYPNSQNIGVWLYNANIEYLVGKHIPLFVVAVLVFFFLFLPYTLLLFFGQWLQALSHLRLFSWINSARLKPFMDSYHAPYKAKHCYWPGLLLVLRFVLLLVFAFNPSQDPNVNLLAILVGTGILHMWAWVSGGVYRNWCLDTLEGSFVLNLTILAASTIYINVSNGNQLAVGYTSISVAFATFIGIFIYNILQQVKHSELCKKFTKLNELSFKRAVKNVNEPVNSLMEDADYNQVHEPLLEDLPQRKYGAF